MSWRKIQESFSTSPTVNDYNRNGANGVSIILPWLAGLDHVEDLLEHIDTGQVSQENLFLWNIIGKDIYSHFKPYVEINPIESVLYR